MQGAPSKRTRTETVFDAIREEILSGRLPAEAKLKLTAYSDKFNVSLSVVRDAMGRLSEQGLLQANPQRGFSTLPLSVEDLTALTRARVLVETAALRESIAHGDLGWETEVVAAHHRLAATPVFDEFGSPTGFGEVHRHFHATLLVGSSNTHLEAAANGMRERSQIYQQWSHYFGDDLSRDVAGEHRRLAEQAVARDDDGADQTLREHIERTTEALLAYMRQREQDGAVRREMPWPAESSVRQ
jgi:DNA-binding GntR family transcriptional regulator